MAVRARIIHGPVSGVAEVFAAENVGVFEPRAGPLVGNVHIGGDWKVVIFDGWVFAERLLREQKAPAAQQNCNPQDNAQAHDWQARSASRITRGLIGTMAGSL